MFDLLTSAENVCVFLWFYGIILKRVDPSVVRHHRIDKIFDAGLAGRMGVKIVKKFLLLWALLKQVCN